MMSLLRVSLPHRVVALLSIFLCCLPGISRGQDLPPSSSEWKYRPELLEPFWESQVVFEEPILFVRDPISGEARGRLLFPVEEIISVQDASGRITYLPDSDYRLETGKDEVFVPKTSKIVTTLAKDLRRPANSQPHRLTHRDGGDEILFGGKLEYHRLQTKVTYKKKINAWKAVPLSTDEPTLVRTKGKLVAKKPVTIVLLGDSISTGCNASGWGGESPFQPAYQDLWLQHLQATFSSEVQLINLAVGGMATPWGITKVEEVMSHRPDLVVIAFGMNDAGGISPEAYRANTKRMIDDAKSKNPETEFILVASMLGNKDWTALRHEVFPKFRDELASLCGPDVAIADMTTLWEEMLRRKKDADLTGNGVNHPNDFGHRVYAQVLHRLITTP